MKCNLNKDVYFVYYWLLLYLNICLKYQIVLSYKIKFMFCKLSKNICFVVDELNLYFKLFYSTLFIDMFNK